MISSALYRFFGMVQISYIGFLPLSIWTRNFRLGQQHKITTCTTKYGSKWEPLIKNDGLYLEET